MKLTRTLSNVLNIAQGITQGRRARLFLLEHAKTGGFSKGLEIAKGRLVSDSSEGEGESVGQIKIEVSESTTITAAMLRDCAGFAYMQPHENAAEARVIKVVSRKEPLGELSRVWEFACTPEGITMAI
jgi:hypothetical protein